MITRYQLLNRIALLEDEIDIMRREIASNKRAITKLNKALLPEEPKKKGKNNGGKNS